MKNHAKRALAILLVCVMALSLAACGAKVDEAVVGRYSLITYSYMGLEFPAGYGDIDGYIELKKSGTLTVQLTTGDDDDNIGSGKFSIEGTTMTIDDGDDTLTATIENNVITLEEDDVTFRFARDGSDEAAALIEARDAVRTTLTGTWAVEGALTLVFREDGTGQLDENEPFVFFGSDSVVYLVYDSDNTTETLRYTLSEDGSALTITTDDGDDITLQRQ